jgi:UDP-GlcNAc:undecaprenyl-phosphate GlcNAc-1-phosphate transferase
MSLLTVSAVLALGFALCLALVPAVRAIAARTGRVVQPSDDRWHRRPVPHLGGVAMFVALFAVLAAIHVAAPLAPLCLASAAMCAIGLVDDLRPISPTARLVAQMVVAALLLYWVPAVRITGFPVPDLIFGFVWLVGLTNAFNLLDNIDGLAAGVAAIAGAFFLAILVLNGGGILTPLALAMGAFVGVALGFLVYNFEPASIFMGDSGSYFLGSFIAGATLLATPGLKAELAPAVAIPVVILLIPIFDTVFVTLTRRLSGRSPFVGGRDHISHRLVSAGIGERRAVLLLYVLTCFGGCIALVFRSAVAPPHAWAVAALYVTVLVAIGLYLGHIEVSHDDAGTAPVPLLPSELTSRYRIYEVLLDAVLIVAAYYLAFSLRFSEPQFSNFLPYFSRALPLIIAVQLAAFALSGKYRQVWRALAPTELWQILRAVAAASAGSVITLLYLYGFQGHSRSVFVYDFVLLLVLVVGARVGFGAVDEYLLKSQSRGRAALIYGAGFGGALAVRELLQNASLGLRPIGFVDDDPRRQRLRLDGLLVRGTSEDLPALLAAGGISALVISIRDLPNDKFDRICALCDQHGVEVRRMRFALEDVDWRERTAGIVRFPGR